MRHHKNIMSISRTMVVDVLNDPSVIGYHRSWVHSITLIMNNTMLQAYGAKMKISSAFMVSSTPKKTIFLWKIVKALLLTKGACHWFGICAHFIPLQAPEVSCKGLKRSMQASCTLRTSFSKSWCSKLHNSGTAVL